MAAKARATFPARIAAAAICAAVVARGFAVGAPNHRASSRVLCRNRGESAVFFCMISTFLDFPKTVSPATLTLHEDSASARRIPPISAAVDRADLAAEHRNTGIPWFRRRLGIPSLLVRLFFTVHRSFVLC